MSIRDDPFLKMVLPPDARIVAVIRQLLESVDLATTSPRVFVNKLRKSWVCPKGTQRQKGAHQAEIAASVARQEEEDDEDADTDVLDDTPMSPTSTTAKRASVMRRRPIVSGIADNPDITANTSNLYRLLPAVVVACHEAIALRPKACEPLPLILSQKRKYKDC